MPNLKKPKNKIFAFLILILLVGFLIPQHFSMPVEGAGTKSYHQNSYWFYPWGTSITHKGVDIFSREGTSIHSSTPGLVIYTGQLSKGGNIVLVLGPKWRLHYYAHLTEIKTTMFSWVDNEKTIGTVGTTGNAKGKPAHLHYAIVSVLPYVWRIDRSKQGWKKMFYLNPIEFLIGLMMQVTCKVE